MPRLKCSLGGAVCVDGWYVQCQQMSLPQSDRQVASGLAWNGLQGPSQGEPGD